MKKRPSKFNIIKRLFFIIMMATAVYVLARSSIFEVKEIRVVGNNVLSEEKLVAASGINLGENIFQLDLKSSTQRIEIIPVIKNVEIVRVLPAAVEIKIEERQPLALLPIQDGFIQVDEDGVCLQNSDLLSSQVPVVTGVEFETPSPGEKIESHLLETGLTVAKGLPAGLLPMISEINVNGDQVIMYTLDGIQCRLGILGDVQRKGEVFMKVLEELKDKGKRINYIDLSLAESPVVKYAE